MLDALQTLSFVMMGVALILMSYKLVYIIISFFKGQKLKDTECRGKFAILIPARNESAVIKNLLQSIKAQDYDKDKIDVYVIVEDKKDLTVEICRSFGYTSFVRRRLDKKGKGNALNEAVKHIKNTGKKYDAFFVFDADNVLRCDFITQMNRAYQSGYDIAIGHRLSKNGDDSWVAACSTLTFTMLNTISNKARSYLKSNVILSGTGFYISNKVIEKIGGWKFFSLTEDYELSLYSVINNYKTRYVEQAKYYDEQPTSLKISKMQRLRWIKGYINVRKNYKKELNRSLKDNKNLWSKVEQIIGVVPFALFVVGFFAYLSYDIIGFGIYMYKMYLLQFIFAILLVYGFLVVLTIVLMMVEGKNLKLSFFRRVTVILLNPIFMLMYLPIAIKAMFKKEVEWKPIEHKAIINIDDLKG